MREHYKRTLSISSSDRASDTTVRELIIAELIRADLIIAELIIADLALKRKNKFRKMLRYLVICKN